MRLRSLFFAPFLPVLAAAAAACSSTSDLAGSGSFNGDPVGSAKVGGGEGSIGSSGGLPGQAGATAGGQQDIGLARKIINGGGVPPADSLTVEGLLSEHDIPTEGAPCTGLLCARPATAFAPSIETGKKERWVQIGMTSGLGNFQRPPLDTVVVLDQSSSMGVDIAQTTESIARMIDKLRDDDRVAILAFADSVTTVKPLGPPGSPADRAALKATVKGIAATGGANMSKGMMDGFALAKASFTDPKRLHRVMLFTCGYPDSQSQGPGSFVTLVNEGADAHVGFSLYGILLGFDSGVANHLAQSRGGSYSYIDDLDKIEKLFDTDFDYMVTPLAYDLKFALTLPPELQLQRLYGIPNDPAGSPKSSFDVKTAFISKRRGAIIARVEDKPGSPPTNAPPTTGSVRLQYEPERAVMDMAPADETTSIASIASAADQNAAPAFSGIGVRKAVFLVNELEGMKKAVTLYTTDRPAAQKQIQALLDVLRPEFTAIADPALDAEIKLVEKLQANMK